MGLAADLPKDTLPKVELQLMLCPLPPLTAEAPRSSQWPKLEKEHLAAEPICQVCREMSHELLAVHHIQPYHLFPTLELDRTNLITLCHFCHFLWGHGKNWKNYNPSIRRHVIDIASMLGRIVKGKPTQPK